MAELDLRKWRRLGRVVIDESLDAVGIGRLMGSGSPPFCEEAPASARTPCCVLVSDDGAAADHAKLGPLCEEKQVPFVLAVVKDFVGSKAGIGYMDLAQLAEMDRLGCEIVGHTVSHPDLSTLGGERLEREIVDCILWLREQGWAARHFVYPYGARRARAESLIRQFCESACIATGGIAKPPFLGTQVPRHAFGSFCHQGVRTFDGYRRLVDEAVREKRMLIWMLHTWSSEHDANQQAILRDLIDYMRSVGMEIRNMSDAWSEHGNLWESPPGHGSERILDCDGVLWEASSRLLAFGGLAEKMIDTPAFGMAIRSLRKVRHFLTPAPPP